MEEPTGAQGPRPREWIHRVWSTVLVGERMIFAVVAGAGFLSGSVVSVRYFAEFGIAPFDVGYSTRDSLMTAALLLLIVIATMVFGAALFFCFYAAKTFAGIAWRGSREELESADLTRRKAAGGVAFYSVVALAGFFWVIANLPNVDHATAGIVLWSIIVTCGAAWWNLSSTAPLPEDGSLGPRSPTSFGLSSPILARDITVTLVFLLLLYIVAAQPARVADEVKRTGEGWPTPMLLGPRAQPAVLRSNDASVPTSAVGKCVLRLGVNGDSVAVWVPESAGSIEGHTLILRAGAVTFEAPCSY